MPLVKSSSEKAFKTNVSNLMHEAKAGTSKHVQSPKQALAIAYSVKRRNRAAGGQLKPAGWQTRSEARGMMHSGPIMSAVAGRTDHHAIHVPSNSYILPADHVSSIGQGNTANGMAVLNHMFSSGPYGGPKSNIKMGAGAPRPPKAAGLRASGGANNGTSGEPTPIMAAGGEYVIEPHIVAAIGGGDVKRGHAILDHWVKENRKKHIKTLRKLPGPAKD